LNTTPLREAQLRDYLSAHLEIIENDLVLVDTEYPLRNDVGADGFIDILARDPSNDLVIIELKKSDQTSRQALHELEKYVGLLASARGIRIDRLRAVLLSTTWHELLVPFTRFVGHADFFVAGRLLVLGADGFPKSSELVNLPELSNGRETCPLHLALLFETVAQRPAAKVRALQALDGLEIEDYVLLELDYVGSDTRVITPFALYLVFPEFSEAFRDHIRLLFPDDCEEEPENSPWWHEQLAQTRVVEVAEANDVEISSPERFATFDGWERVSVMGSGQYDDGIIWNADQLESLVRADGEQYSIPFERRVAVANKAAWSRMRQDLKNCLLGFGDWPEMVMLLLDEFETHPHLNLTVYAYAPADILMGLEAVERERSGGYMPQLLLEWTDGAETGFVGGRIHWDEKTRVLSAEETLGRVSADFMQYMTARAGGSVWEFESELCRLHGLSYELVAGSTVADATKHELVQLIPGAKLQRSPLIGPVTNTEAFWTAHRDYLRDLASLFDSYTIRM
jgi:hypothetical protein